jgi:hypothetical protein
MYFSWLSVQIAIISLNSVNRLIFAMVRCGFLFEVRTEFLNNVYTSFDFKILNNSGKYMHHMPNTQ